MIRAMSALTAELDDPNAAIADVLEQLDLTNRLLAHSVGIITCHYEYVHAGIAQAVSAALPFDTVGATTTGQAIPGDRGILSLAVMVLTSDDVLFATAGSEPISEVLDAPIEAAYRQAEGALGKRPDMMLTFAPLLLQYAGDQYVEALDRVSGGVPNFGTLSMGDSMTYEDSFTLVNGVAAHDTLAVVLLSGDVHPTFAVATVSGANVLSQRSVITSSSGNLLREINGQPLVTFLEGLGLAVDGSIAQGMSFLVCIIDHHDGMPPLGKVLIRINEAGDGVCGGYMPEGSTLYISTLTRDEVVETTGKVIQGVLDKGVRDVLLAFSCNTRNVALGSDVYAEFDAARDAVRGRMPFLISSSGGEICPFVDERGKITNRYHNNSFIVCTF